VFENRERIDCMHVAHDMIAFGAQDIVVLSEIDYKYISLSLFLFPLPEYLSESDSPRFRFTLNPSQRITAHPRPR
jgi:hypothetical protein